MARTQGDGLSVAIYDPAGISQQLVGLTATQTLTNKTFTAPKFANSGYIADANGNEMLIFSTTTNAVNNLQLTNGAAGGGVILSSVGDSAGVPITISPKESTAQFSYISLNSWIRMSKGFTMAAETDDGNSGTADTIDWNASNTHKSTVTGNVTYTFTAPYSGTGFFILKLINGGAYNPSWPATVKWVGATEPTWTASGTDIITFYYDGTNYYGSATLAHA